MVIFSRVYQALTVSGDFTCDSLIMCSAIRMLTTCYVKCVMFANFIQRQLITHKNPCGYIQYKVLFHSPLHPHLSGSHTLHYNGLYSDLDGSLTTVITRNLPDPHAYVIKHRVFDHRHIDARQTNSKINARAEDSRLMLIRNRG